jgi:hypothetical protein
MPIGPNSIPVDRTLINYVFDSVDAKIRDAEYMRIECNEETFGPRWTFVGVGTLQMFEKDIIKKAYHSAGWDYALVMNSGDNDERPGLWSVKLGVFVSEFEKSIPTLPSAI